jgi:hypothetical protein
VHPGLAGRRSVRNPRALTRVHYPTSIIPMTSADLLSNFLARSRYYLNLEYPLKLRRAVEALSHLAGNVRQWIVCGVGHAPDDRNRAAEFAARDGAPAALLLSRLDGTLAEADAVLARQTPQSLAEQREIQGRSITVLDAVYHVVEHFSMHLGQVILLAKLHAPGSVRFYDDAGGLARPLWEGDPTAPNDDRRAST